MVFPCLPMDVSLHLCVSCAVSLGLCSLFIHCILLSFDSFAFYFLFLDGYLFAKEKEQPNLWISMDREIEKI